MTKTPSKEMLEFRKWWKKWDEESTKLVFRKMDIYSPHKPLVNIHNSASFCRLSPTQAVLGVWAKHLEAIVTMIHETRAGRKYPIAEWDEKCMDSRNYSQIMAWVARQEAR